MYRRTNMPGVVALRAPRRLRGLRRPLGCATCGPMRLGQDVYDPVTGTYGTSLPPQDNPVYSPPIYGPPAPTPAEIAYDKMVTAGSTPNPLYNFQPISSTPAPSFSLPGIPGIPAVPAFGMPAAAAPSSSLSSYLPYVVLGLGGIALISVLKRR